jgi:hypothetical protein
MKKARSTKGKYVNKNVKQKLLSRGTLNRLQNGSGTFWAGRIHIRKIFPDPAFLDVKSCIIFVNLYLKLFLICELLPLLA